MYFSEDLIEEVRQKNDIVDVISGYVKLQKKGSSYFGLCPRNPLLFQSAAESRCIIASDAVREAMYLHLLWNMRIILSWKRLRCLLSGQE